MIRLFRVALERLRQSAPLRRSLAAWATGGLVLSEAFTVAIVLVSRRPVLVGCALLTLAWWALILVVFAGGAAMLDSPEGQALQRYGIPNGLTALRAWACVPLLFVATLGLPGGLALALWAGVGGAVGLLDAVDGAIARSLGPISVLGKAIDPFGDALFFIVGSIGSALLGIVPVWLGGLIIVRYALPLLVTPVVFAARRRPELVHTVWGRRNTILTGVVLFVLFWVRLAGGPVDAVALGLALPTLVPTAVLHAAALLRRTLEAPVA